MEAAAAAAKEAERAKLASRLGAHKEEARLEVTARLRNLEKQKLWEMKKDNQTMVGETLTEEEMDRED